MNSLQFADFRVLSAISKAKPEPKAESKPSTSRPSIRTKAEMIAAARAFAASR